MYRTFNMGIGFCLIMPKNSVDNTTSIVEKHKMRVFDIGEIDSCGISNVVAKINGKKYIMA